MDDFSGCLVITIVGVVLFIVGVVLGFKTCYEYITTFNQQTQYKNELIVKNGKTGKLYKLTNVVIKNEIKIAEGK